MTFTTTTMKRATALASALALLASGAHAQDTAQTQAAPAQAAPVQTAPAAETPGQPVPATPAEPAPASPQAPASTAPAPVAATPAPAAPAVAQLNPIDPPPAGKGQIVFYCPSRFVGALVSFSVREGDTGIGKLTNGTYFVHVTDPGVKEYNISFEARDTLRMEVEEGETYYVNQAIAMGVIGARPNLTPSTEAAFQEKKLQPTTAKATDRH